MAAERRGISIPIRLGDFSILDSEFNNIRERFDAEMHKMEEEMSKFRSELLSRESSIFSKTSSSLHTSEARQWMDDVRDKMSNLGGVPSTLASSSVTSSSSTSSSTTTTGGSSTLAAPTSSGWLDSLHSPLIQEDGQSKQLKLRFDVSQYAPEEIVVKTVDNKLLVHAKHEEKTDTKSVYREYNREFLLPKGTDPEAIRSSLSKDGVLTVEAPLPALAAGEKMIPIAQN